MAPTTTSAQRTLFGKPITLETLPDLFAFHTARFGSFEMNGNGSGGDGSDSGSGGDDGDGDGGDGSGSGSGDEGGSGSGEGSGDGNSGKDGKSGGQGFPANTPVKDMTAEQRAAYYEHQSRRHEERNKELLKITGGKYGDDLKAEFEALEQLHNKDRTEGERAVENAKKETRAETVKEIGVKSARVALEFALGHDPEKNDQSDLIETLDLTKVLKDDGEVDTAKVRSLVAKIAPAGKGEGGQRHDYGGGRRGSQGGGKSGIAAGRDAYADRHNRKSKSDS